MRALVIGGTGLISTGVVKHLLARGADVTVVNRGKRPSDLPPAVRTIVGDRNEHREFAGLISAQEPFDVVVDMVCFNAEQATAAVAAFAGRCGHFLFCSTVCTYGVKSPPGILVPPDFPQEPISDYGRNKVAAEQVFLSTDKFPATVIRPSQTYGPSHPMIDNLEFDAVAWDRVAKGLPVLCCGDGLGLWVSTHRDDVGKLFAYAAMNPRTYGQCYNATRPQHTTWRGYYHDVAAALGTTASLIFMPADWIVRHDPKRFGLLREITQFHGAYDAATSRRDVPEFVCDVGLTAGAAEAFADAKRRGKWKSADGDDLYQRMVDEAVALGQTSVTV